MPKGIPLTEEEQEIRRREIFAASLHLFLEKGFTETSMREIAAAAGIGKSTLYDYYTSKDEILVSYFEGEIKKITEGAQKIVQQDLNNSEKLMRIMQMHLEYLVENKQNFMKLSFEAQRLSADSQDQIQVKRHTYQDMVRAIVEEGIRTGEFRPVNPLFAARNLFSLLSLAVFTSRPTGTPEEMLDEAMGIFFHGVKV
jgi:AcrR family transcriptional regulator